MTAGTSAREYFETAVSFIGEDWLQEQDNRFRDNNLQRNPPPPVQKYHRGLRELDYVDDEFDEHFPGVSMPTLEFINLGRYVSALDTAAAGIVEPDTYTVLDTELSTRFAPRLRNPDEYEKTLFELRTAAFYAQRGETVHFIEETQDAKTPDLLLRIPSRVFVECKRVDAGSTWEQKQHGLAEVLMQKTVNQLDPGHVAVYEYSRSPTRSEIEAIDETLPHMIRTAATTLDLAFGTVTVYRLDEILGPGVDMWMLNTERDVRAEYEEVYETFLQPLVKKTCGRDLFLNDIESKLETDLLPYAGRVDLANLRFAAIVKDTDRDYVTRVARQVEKARRKFGTDHPNIVHIDMPYSPVTAEKIVDDLRQQIGRQLAATRRVTAVTLSFSVKERNETGAQSIRQQGASIRHYDPYASLPEDFDLLGNDLT